MEFFNSPNILQGCSGNVHYTKSGKTFKTAPLVVNNRMAQAQEAESSFDDELAGFGAVSSLNSVISHAFGRSSKQGAAFQEFQEEPEAHLAFPDILEIIQV